MTEQVQTTEQSGATEQTASEKALATQGATKEHLDASTTGQAPKAPEVRNAPEPKAEEEPKKEEEGSVEDPEQESEEQATEETKEDEQSFDELKKADIEKGEYPVYNDESADAITAILKEAEISIEDAYALFGDKENPTLEDIDQEGLVKRLGKAKAAAVMSMARDFYNRNVADVQATVTKVLDTVGGKESFEKIKTWAHRQEAADPEFHKRLNEYRKMFDGGAVSAELAAQALLREFNADSKNRSLNSQMTHGDAAVSAGSDKGLSRNEYLTKRKEAEKTGNVQEINRLIALRTLGRKQGL